MKLSRLLETNESCKSAIGLADNFGDYFLIKNNKIYSRIRQLTIAAGFQYSLDKNDDYYTLPLSQLESILENRKIPYINNISVLKKFESQYKNEFLWDDIADGLKKNYIFHESCHAVIRSTTLDITAKSQSEKIFKILFEESFANTCELLAVTDAQDTIHRIFYEWNSYTFLFDDRTHLKNAIALFGESQFFTFILLSYLHSNFLRDELTEKELARILNSVFSNTNDSNIFNAKNLKTLRALAKITFTLDRRFREVTTGFHLRLNGLQTNRTELLNFDLMNYFEAQKEYQQLTDALTHELFCRK